MSLVFDPRVVLKSRKAHQCYACGAVIPKGKAYIGYPGKNDDGEFLTVHLCIECSYLLTQKTGANAHNIRQGEFRERLLPNFLRKKRAEFRKDPRKAIVAAGLMQKVTAISAPNPCNQIVVKRSEFERRIFHLPESRYKAEQFTKGATLTVKAGVTGASRTATIKGVWSTDGSAFGCNKRQVAVLVA